MPRIVDRVGGDSNASKGEVTYTITNGAVDHGISRIKDDLLGLGKGRSTQTRQDERARRGWSVGRLQSLDQPGGERPSPLHQNGGLDDLGADSPFSGLDASSTVGSG